MDGNGHDNVFAFDTLYTNNRIQIMKTILPYMGRGQQKQFAVLIKVMELQHTMQMFEKKESQLQICSIPPEESVTPNRDPAALLLQIGRYCTEEQRQKLEQIKGMQDTMKKLKEMQELMELIKLFDEEETENNDGIPKGKREAFDFGQILESMLTPSQQELYRQFSGNFPKNETETEDI